MRQYLESFFDISNLTEARFYSTPGGKIKINTIVPETTHGQENIMKMFRLRLKQYLIVGLFLLVGYNILTLVQIINVQIYEEFYLTAYFAP